MNPLASRTRRAVPAFVVALALGVSACGEEDVKSGAKQGADKAQDAAGKAEKKAREAKKDAER